MVTDTTRTVFTLDAITIINPSIRWFEIAEISNKTAEYVGQMLNHTWFLHYLYPV